MDRNQIDLTNGQPGRTIGIWGGGLVGLSTAAYFARKGWKSLIYDVNIDQVSRINRAILPTNFADWVGFSAAEYIFSEPKLIEATTDISRLLDDNLITYHFVAVPTERNGEPYMGAIHSVMESISKTRSRVHDRLCIIESTMVPGSTETLARRYAVSLGVATRRDWFTARENNLENCVRVYCGMSDEVSGRMHEILAVVCKSLALASSCTVVELTKALDNGIFHTNAMYASQVATAYPNANVAEAFELAATHWRLGNHVYFPSLGTGGPCVPLANKYLLDGASHPEKLTIAKDAVRYDEINPVDVASLVRRELSSTDKVAILGICYRGDIKSHAGSPHLRFCRALLQQGVSVSVHDPYYDNKEIEQINCHPMVMFPNALSEYKLIYIGADHAAYKTHITEMMDHLRCGQMILDNQGIMSAYATALEGRGIAYHRVGGPQWLPSATASIKPTKNDHSQVSGNGIVADENHVVFETKFFQIHALPDQHNPQALPWYVVQRPDSVVVIPFDSATKSFLMQQQYRQHTNTSSWEFPGGAIDRGESPAQSADRELMEETGLNTTKVTQIGSFHPLPGLSAQQTYVFLAQLDENQLATTASATAAAKEEGISEYRSVDFHTWSSLVASSQIVDGITLSAFALWRTGCQDNIW